MSNGMRHTGPKPWDWTPDPDDWPTVDDMAALNKTMPKGMVAFTVDSLAEAYTKHCRDIEVVSGTMHICGFDSTDCAAAIIKAAKEAERETE